MSSAFRHFGIAKKFWKFLIMMAPHPITGKKYYFIDKCMPFGASISCSHFQRFSNAIAYIIKMKSKKENVNYLDDFLFVAMWKVFCNQQVELFVETCNSINFPVSKEKTTRASSIIIFLGLLIDTMRQMVFVPVDKVMKARELIQKVITKRSLRVKTLQKITGYLNFLGKAIVPGRAFTRRLYAMNEEKYSKMKKYHHIPMKQELKLDLKTWLEFLEHQDIFGRDFLDFNDQITSEEINMYTDASAISGPRMWWNFQQSMVHHAMGGKVLQEM